MAIAGRVAMIPKGDYDATVTYQILDVVRYNDASYVAKKSSTGMLPTDTEYWMLMTQDGLLVDDSFSETSENPVQNKVVNEAIQNILNGTTPAGDSNKLGGKGASEYALAGELATSYDGWGDKRTEDTNIQDYVYKMVFVGIKANSAINMTDAPNSHYSYVFGLLGFSDTSGGKAHELAFNHDGVWHRQIDGDNSKTDWEKLSTTADLANYLPKTGGTVTTDSSNELPQLPVIFTNGVNANGSVVRFDDTRGALGHFGFVEQNVPIFSNIAGTVYPLLHSGNVGSYALPNTGGELHSTTEVPLRLSADATTSVQIGFKLNDNTYRFLYVNKETGDFGVHVPNVDIFTLLHSGNSAKVVQAASAPSDTTAMWYDTANKAWKRYVDGAWQA